MVLGQDFQKNKKKIHIVISLEKGGKERNVSRKPTSLIAIITYSFRRNKQILRGRGALR